MEHVNEKPLTLLDQRLRRLGISRRQLAIRCGCRQETIRAYATGTRKCHPGTVALIEGVLKDAEALAISGLEP